MITQRIILRDYNWAVTILYECDCSDIQEITDHLLSIDCSQDYIEEALDNLNKCDENTGLIYSNYSLNRSIIVINKDASIEEIINTIVHESFHLINHLATKFNINNEETLASLIGTFVMNTYDVVKDIRYAVN